MNPFPLLNALLGARSKRHRRASRFLVGSPGSFLNTSTLLTAAGLAVGAYEIYRSQRGGSSSTTTVLGNNPPPVSTTTVVPGPPPVPTPQNEAAARERLVRLAMSAARADGTLGEEEYAKIIAAAREVGLEPLVTAEFGKPRTLAEIVSGVRDPKEKTDLYVLAFTIVRADEDVVGAERVYLAQLANALGLEPAAVARLEKETADRIDHAD
jgi:uncharacterized membrane protein YebE (DUF533 family)